jgi:PAS domain S-box-containing protein
MSAFAEVPAWPSLASNRRRAEAALGLEQQPSVQLLQALPAAVYTTDAEGRITFYNEAAVALWGCRPELGKSEFCGSWKLYWPDGRPLPHDQCPMALALKEKRPIRGMEAVAERPDGTRVPFIPYPTPLFDADGNLTGAVNMLVDISERKQAEQRLARHTAEQTVLYRFTDSLYRAGTANEVYDSALDAIVRALHCERAAVLLCDESGVMRFIAWRGLSDAYRRAVEGHSPWARDAKDPQPVCIDDIESAGLDEPVKAAVRAEGIGALAFIPLMTHGRLTGKFMAYYDRPHVFTSAEIDLAVTIARQLGFAIENMGAEQDRQRLAAIVASSDDAIVSKGLDGIIASWNAGAERLYGYSAAEIVGKSITTLMPADRQDEEPAILDRIRRGLRVEPYETVRWRKDGGLIDVSVSVSPVRDADGRIVGAANIARDISERKRAQEQQSLLLREMSHRVKNLFAVAGGMIALSVRTARSPRDMAQSIQNRLDALSRAHDLTRPGLIGVPAAASQATSLHALIRSIFAPYVMDRTKGREGILVTGPDVTIGGTAVTSVALILHELATNAAKYGSLSISGGVVHVDCSLIGDDLWLAWKERGGPPIEREPESEGFGAFLVRRLVSSQFGGQMSHRWERNGVTIRLSVPLQRLQL